MRPNHEPTGPRDWPLSRRQLLKIGGLGSLGLNLAGPARAEATLARRQGRRPAPAPIRSCILVFYYGGPSHLDTWDMKPKAPARGPRQFGSIATNVPGLRVCEHLPHTARVMDRLAVVRSMHHPMTNHNAAAFATLCGRNPLKGDLERLGNDRNDPPCLGAAISALLPKRQGLPTFVALPYVMYNVVQLPGQIGGLPRLGAHPVPGHADPNAADFRLGELELPGDLTLDRLDHRESLLHLLDGQLRRAELMAGTARRRRRSTTYNAKAFDLLRSAGGAPRVRPRPGGPASSATATAAPSSGQCVLLARRLVEAGVRFVTVYDGQYNGQTANWDSHENVFGRHKDDLLPPADRAFAALIEDLTERGLLDATLVIAMGEFGRTPKDQQATPGRDHWPYCYSVVLAGGGVAGRDHLRRQRQARRLPRRRRRHPRRPRRHPLLAVRPRPRVRDPRPHRPPLPPGRRPAPPGAVPGDGVRGTID